MGFPDGFNEPTGSKKTIVVEHTPPRNASSPPELCQEPTRPYAYQVGVVDDRSAPGGHNQTANCLRSILSLYRPQKVFEFCLKFWYFCLTF